MRENLKMKYNFNAYCIYVKKIYLWTLSESLITTCEADYIGKNSSDLTIN